MSSLLTVSSNSIDNFSVSAGETSQFSITLPTVSGYKLVAAFHWSLSNASTNGSGASRCTVYQMTNITSYTVSGYIYCSASSATSIIKITIYGLYIKDI